MINEEAFALEGFVLPLLHAARTNDEVSLDLQTFEIEGENLLVAFSSREAFHQALNEEVEFITLTSAMTRHLAESGWSMIVDPHQPQAVRLSAEVLMSASKTHRTS